MQKGWKINFPVPNDVMLIAPLAISDAVSGADLTAFREVMNFDNLVTSFQKTNQYESAGTIWMLDCVIAASTGDSLSISQLESALEKWSPEAFRASSKCEKDRRFTFDVPVPAQVVDIKNVQRRTPEDSTVLFARPEPMLAGTALVIGWYALMLEALRADPIDAQQVLKLLEAGMSVPIRLRLSSDPDECRLIGLRFSESMFVTAAAAGADSFWKFCERTSLLTGFKNSLAKNESVLKMGNELKNMASPSGGRPSVKTQSRP